MEEELEKLKIDYEKHLEDRKSLGRKYNVVPGEIKTRVRELHTMGMSVREIARGLGASRSVVDYWLHGDRYGKKRQEKKAQEQQPATEKFREIKIAPLKATATTTTIAEAHVCGIVLQLKEHVEASGFSTPSEAAEFAYVYWGKSVGRQSS